MWQVQSQDKNKKSAVNNGRRKAFLNEHDIKNHIRLACFCDVNSDMAVFVPQTIRQRFL